tara:strand:- start:246 stop:947 length:702 start_codon:yes stop_codon:yes gene_type:complete
MNKALVITGGSKGIGLATSKLFYKSDYKIINLSRSQSNLDSVHNIKVDLSQKNWEKEISEDLLSSCKGMDQISLVHNACLMTGDNVESIAADSLRNILEINLISPVILNTLLIPLMNKGSSVIYVASTLGTKAVAQMTSYVTSKHAMVGLMKSTTQDLVGRFIHSACVCPGFTNTEMLRDYVGGSEEVLAGMAEGLSEKRLIEPIEIANTILFCAQNSVVNGTILHANLGAIE